MVAHGADLAVFHEDDDIGFLDGSDTLGNDQLGGAGDLIPEGLTDQGIGTGSTAEVESSRIRILGFFSRARAMHRRCF